jgi:hypothetical protein
MEIAQKNHGDYRSLPHEELLQSDRKQQQGTHPPLLFGDPAVIGFPLDR